MISIAFAACTSWEMPMPPKRVTKAEAEELATSLILEQLKAGTVPWHKPWSATVDIPTSLSSGKPYKGFNYLCLDIVKMGAGYEHPLWGTFEYALKHGGHVRKGEKHTKIFKFDIITKEDDAGKEKTFPIWRIFQVFNIGQMDNVPLPTWYDNTPREPVPVLDGVEQALHYPNGPKVEHVAQNRAYYTPSLDIITLPELLQFRSAEAYAGTALHEAVHSTGHSSRLDRFDNDTGRFGCEGYAKEELVAEIGASMLAAMLNINVEWDQHAAYVSSWLKALQDDQSLILWAARKAQHAIDLIVPEVAAVQVAA